MENIPFLLHFCTICVIIQPIGLEGLRSFYNKIPDNVRERTPSVMVYNPNKLNSPSGSELPKKIMALIGAAAFALGAAGCNGETHSEPTPDTTTSTAQETQNPISTLSPTPSPEASTTKAEKDIPQEIIDKYKDVNLSDIRGLLEKEKSGEEVSYNEWRAKLVDLVNKTTSDENAKVVTDENGLIKTTHDNLTKDMNSATLNSTYLMFYTGAIYKDSQLHDYPLSAKDAEALKKHVLDTMTGQANSLFKALLEPGKDNYAPLFNITPSNLILTVKFTSSGKKDGAYTTYVFDPSYKTDKCSVAGNIADCKTEGYPRRGVDTPETQMVVNVEHANNKGDEIVHTDVVVRAFTDGALPEDVSDLNKPGFEPANKVWYANRFSSGDEEIFATATLGGFSKLTKESFDKEFLIQNGKIVAPSDIPEIDKPEN
jgi:hypothetical protein